MWTGTMQACHPIIITHEKLVPSFSLDSSPMWGQNPKSKSVK